MNIYICKISQFHCTTLLCRFGKLGYIHMSAAAVDKLTYTSNGVWPLTAKCDLDLSTVAMIVLLILTV